jgi:hypothetical protein
LSLERLEPRSLLASDIVIHWNDVALAAFRTDRTPPPIASRALAIMHAAIYDSVNAIDRTHEVYAVDVLASPLASREAAVAAAAERTLSTLFPAQAGTFAAQLEASLGTVADGLAEDRGVALGVHVADEMLALRADDGSGAVVPYTPGTEPGDWQPAPPAFAPALLPQWADVKPFAMNSGSQFSPDDVPPLTSRSYTAAFNEVQELGSATSSSRTADQTNIALFWANGAGTATPPGHLNMMAQIVAEKERNTLSENARLFAALNVAMADAAIMAWDSKFQTDFWRPVTAIRAAGTDGNPNTEAEAEWTPLIVTPPFPSYVSGHASFSGAAAAVLETFFGRDRVRFTLPSENPAVPARSFGSFSQAARESADSRLFGGIHWRFDNEDGLRAGRRLGSFVGNNFFQPANFGVSAGLIGETLVVHGSHRHDNLRIEQAASRIAVYSLGRRLAEFAAAEIAAIEIDVRGGHDFVSLGESIGVSATILGGEGHDILRGGAADDTLLGGAGHDVLFGLLGDDLLDGGEGNDVLFGGPGEDTMLGRRGRNRLFQ